MGVLVELLHRVIDPEVGVNIVDLGLVRDVDLDDVGDVEINMTLTTPSCPLGPYMVDNIDQVLGELPWVNSTDVNIVWEPPWNPQTDMTDFAKRQLGWMH
ncbi:MAG: metal-sulfur cluster assembly factor [Tepidiformaceae bacterium]